MEISLDIRKSVEENAAGYFEKGKKAKGKLAGARKAIERTQEKLHVLLEKKSVESEEAKTVEKREKKWFEKFRWFISSEGFLCVGGRDATTNEIVVKKHAEKGDIVFHTEMAGSPFFVIKAEGKKIGNATLEEAAIAVASFSRAWKLGLTHAETFHVAPEQLSKTPKPGEYLEKGAFIVNGKANKITAESKLALGVTPDSLVMCGPVAAVKKNCAHAIEVIQGSVKPSDAAKAILKKLNLPRDYLDDIIRALPNGGIKIAN